MSRRERRWLDVAAAVLIALALARGVAVTYDLDWPNDPDLYRDIAQAQTILDGSFLADPHYLGETIWYHPLVAYSYVWQIQLARQVVWPSAVPGFHFLRYFGAGESMLAAYGIVTAGAGLAALVARWGPGVSWAAPLTQRTVTVLLAAILVGLAYPAYERRIDLTDYRDQAKLMFQGPDFSDMFGWVRRELRPTDVVAAPESLSLSLVGPAGRKVLAVERFFSNPYVPWEPRDDALQALYAALEGGACDTFRERGILWTRVGHLSTQRRSIAGRHPVADLAQRARGVRECRPESCRSTAPGVAVYLRVDRRRVLRGPGRQISWSGHRVFTRVVPKPQAPIMPRWHIAKS